MLGFLLVVIVLWSVLHVYVAWRVVTPLSVRGKRRTFLYALFVPGVLAVPPLFLAADLFTPDAAYTYRWFVWSYAGLERTIPSRSCSSSSIAFLKSGFSRAPKSKYTATPCPVFGSKVLLT